MVNIMTVELRVLDGFDMEHDTISPRYFEQNMDYRSKFVSHGRSPYRIIAAIAVPNFLRAEQTTAHNQTMVNEGQIVCALERYRLANGIYPGSLDALVQRYVETLPHDLIGGQPLIYRPTADGKFLLYSIGWNEKDDGGQNSPKAQNGNADYAQGDWVWNTGK